MPTGTSKAFQTLTWLEGNGSSPHSVPYGFFLRFMPLLLGTSFKLWEAEV